ncbi:MAG: FmdB family zinc ribbon protein [Candidatus Binatia bacterium]
MPIYEYLCSACKRPFSFLVGVVADSGKPACPRCGGKKLTKLISRVARIKSKAAALEDLADPSRIGNLDDPKAMAQWAKKMGGTLGDEASEDLGAELDEMLDEPGGGEENADGEE